MPSKVVKEYTLQIGPPIGLDGDNGDDFVHVFWMYNDSSQDMSDLRLEEISDDLNAVTYSFDGINYGDTLIKEHLGAYSSAPIYVKIDIPSGVNEGRYSAKMRLVFYDVIEWVFHLYYNVVASRTYLSQNKNFKVGSMPIVVTSVSDALELQDNIVETASGNVRAGDRYRKQNRRLEFVIADEPSQEKTAIEEILPDGNIIELKRGSANIYVVDNTNGIIYELYPQAHKSSINPNAPKFRRSSVAYHPRDGAQVRHHEPRIVDVERVYDVDDDAADFSEGQLYGVTGASGKLQLALAGAPTFTRSSVAYKSDGTQVASGQPRFETVNGRTGVLVEEGTTNLALNPSFENDSNSDGLADNWNLVVGGGISVVASRVASPKFHGSYAQKLEVTSVTPPTSTQFHRIEQIVSVTPNQAYTLSVNALTSTTVYNVDVRIRWRDSGGNVISEARLTSQPTSLTRLSVSGTAPANAVTAILYLGLERPNQQDTTLGHVIFDAVQFEAKSYATTWTVGTRAAETLTVPKEIINTTEGTIEAWVRFNDVSDVHYGPIFAYGGSAPGPRLLIMRDRLYSDIRVWDGDGVDEIGLDSSTVVTTNTWYYVAFTWSPNGRALYVNGVKEATNPRGKPLGSVVENPRLGLWGTGSWLNGFLGPFRISRRARTDQEIAAAYAAGTLTVDKDTTYLLPLNDSLTYGQGGYRIAPVGDLNKVRIVNFSMASWNATTDSNSSVYVDFAVTNDGVSVPNEEQWVRATSGEAVLPIGTDVNGKYLWRREILLTNDTTSNPSLNNITVDVQGKLPQGILIEEETTNLLATASSPTAETVSVTAGARYTASAVGGTLTVYQRHITSTTSDWQSGTLTDVEVV